MTLENKLGLASSAKAKKPEIYQFHLTANYAN